jgi:hypothetical protein
MDHRFAALTAGLVVGVLAGVAVSSARAGEVVLGPEEAKRFVANKVFSYTCFDGTTGIGRIHADGSVIGTMQASGGPVRYVSLPVGTVRLTSDSICAALPRALIQPCFNVVQTSPHSFRGSLRTFSFAYCDFERRYVRARIAGNEERSQQPAQSAVALRPSRY